MEMAEGNPPYMDYPPMRALFLITTKGLPPLKDKDKWSIDFVTFVDNCLVLTPEQRMTSFKISELSFLSKGCAKSVFADIIEKVSEIENSEDDDEEEEEEEEHYRDDYHDQREDDDDEEDEEDEDEEDDD